MISDISLYHGSYKKFKLLKQSPSDLADRPVLFGTPSYLDAVIFSVQWTDYNFSMAIDNDVRYIDEQYPGAFKKLDTVGYIHHITGPFRPLFDGLSNEYISYEDAVPTKIDKINVLDYLRRKNDKELVMRTYDDVMKYKEHSNKKVRLSGDIICWIVSADDLVILDELKTECENNGAKLEIIGRTINGPMKFKDPTIILGDPLVGTYLYTTKCEKKYLKFNTSYAIKLYKSNKKTTREQYASFIKARKRTYSSYDTILMRDVKNIIRNHASLRQSD